MDIQTLYEAIDAMLPVTRSTEQEDFKADLKNELQSYFNLIQALDVAAFNEPKDRDEIISQIKVQIDTLETVVKYSFQGRHSEAYDLFQKQMNGETGILNRISYYKIDTSVKINIEDKEIGERDTIFFRARVFNDKRNQKSLDMFHIPFDQRGKVTTQRYSVPGYPCLYLGTTVYACWEEMHRPHFDDLMISGFKVIKGFTVYDLTVPTVDDYTPERLQKTLLRLPLIIACQIRVKNENAQFKPEYIIPQLLIETIICNNRRNLEQGKSKTDLPWGVIYSSTHKSADFPYGRKFLENIALPVIESDKTTGHCDVLSSLFSISAPLCFEYEALKENASRPSWSSFSPKEYERYEQSRIGYMENKIRNSNMYQEINHIYIENPYVHLTQDGKNSEKVFIKASKNIKYQIQEQD